MVNRNHHDKSLFPTGTELQIQPKKNGFVCLMPGKKLQKIIIPKNGALIILYHGKNPLKNITNQKTHPRKSPFGCFRKWWYPQIIHFNRVFHYKPSILGYPYFWKHPFCPPQKPLLIFQDGCQTWLSGRFWKNAGTLGMGAP